MARASVTVGNKLPFADHATFPCDKPLEHFERSVGFVLLEKGEKPVD
jgi:hypothetical protein